MRKSIHQLGLFLLFGLAAVFAPQLLEAQISCVNFQQGSQAGCPRSLTSVTVEIAPTSGTTPVSVSPYSPGSYFRIPVLAGGCYSVGSCAATFDTQISCYQGAATTNPFAYDDDFGPLCPSSGAASVTMVPNFTGYANVDVRTYPCLEGGTSSITVTVQQNNNLAITSSNAAMCQGQNRTLSAVPIPVSGALANSGQPGVFSGTGVSGATFTAPVPAASNQNYTITYNFGYISTSQTINVFHVPSSANAGPDQTVCSSTATLAGSSVIFGSGQWAVTSGSANITSPTAPGTSVTGLVPGASVTLRWTISNGVCSSSTDSVVITRTQDPTVANAGPDQIVCSDSIFMAGNSANVGSGVWSVVTGTGLLANPANPLTMASNLTVGVNRMIWSISNGVCPPSVDTVMVQRDAQPPQPIAGPDKQICDPQTSLTGNIPPIGSGTWSIISGSGIVNTPSSPNSMITAVNVGSTVLQWAFQNGTCPIRTDTIVVTRNPLPNSPTVSGNQTVCVGTSATINASSNAANPTYLWWDAVSGGNLLAAGSTYTTPPLLGPIVVYAEVNDGNTSCSSTRTQYTINVSPLPLINLGADSTFCSSDTVCLDAGPGMTAYQWSTGATSRVLCTNQTGTYWVQITNGSGCQATDTIHLVATPAPIANLGPDFILCTGNSNSIGVTQINGQNYQWSTGATTNNITVTTGGLYTITISDLNGCSDVDEVLVTSQNVPLAAFSMDSVGCANIAFTDLSTDAASWSWSFGDGNSSINQNASHLYNANGTYTVTLIASGICGSDTVQQSLTLNCLVGIALPDNLMITVFPNPNDGIFKIHFEGLDQDCGLVIVNELGQSVYEKDIQGCSGTCDELIDISHVASGIYFAKLKIGDISLTKRVLVR
jgi:PKD repeat protein